MVMKQKALASVEALTRAIIRTAEAVQTHNLIIRLLAVTLKENHSDLSFMPDSVPEAR
jgi:hypothetical protein